MAYMDDISKYSNYGGVGAIMTPGLMGGGGMSMGASAPVAAYNQAFAGGDAPGSLGAGATGQGMNGQWGMGGEGGLGFNMGTGRLLLGGLNTIGNLWMAWQANKLAKQQFNFQKDITNTNLANQIQSYNTTLDDKIRSRAVTEGQTPEQAQAYMDQHKLPTHKAQ